MAFSIPRMSARPLLAGRNAWSNQFEEARVQRTIAASVLGLIITLRTVLRMVPQTPVHKPVSTSASHCDTIQWTGN